MSRLGYFFLALLIVGLACRFYGLNWDAALQLHPDERFCVDTLFKICWPTNWDSFFNSSISPANPANYQAHYVYGQLPLFIGKLWLALWHIDSPVPALVPLRALSGIFDCGTVVFTVLIARRVWEWKWALLAGCGVALAALHVQASHFFTTDTFAAFFGTASFYFAARYGDSRRLPDVLGAGLLFGLALACKVSTLFFGVGLFVFVIAVFRKEPHNKKIFAGFLLSLVVALLAFRVGHPMAFRGEMPWSILDLRPEPRFLGDLHEQAEITKGNRTVPFNIQWIGRAKWLFSLQNLAFWGYGVPLLLSAVLGGALALRNWRSQQSDSRAYLVLGAAGLFILVIFGVQGAAFSKFTRYFLPMTPFVALFATYFWRTLSQSKKWARWGAPVLVGLTALWCFAVTSIYSRTHTRLEASQWIVSNIPPGTVVANETDWDEGLPISWGPTGDGGLKFLKLDSYGDDTEEKREKLLTTLDSVNWIFCSSGRSWQNIPRWHEKYPMTTRFYEALQNGELGFERAQEFTDYPHLGPLQFPDGNLEEALSVYDHPRVILWRKRADYSPDKAREILSGPTLPSPLTNWVPNQAQY